MVENSNNELFLCCHCFMMTHTIWEFFLHYTLFTSLSMFWFYIISGPLFFLVCKYICILFLGRKTVEKISGLVDKVYCYDVYPNKEWVRYENFKNHSLDQAIPSCFMTYFPTLVDASQMRLSRLFIAIMHMLYRVWLYIDLFKILISFQLVKDGLTCFLHYIWRILF